MNRAAPLLTTAVLVGCALASGCGTSSTDEGSGARLQVAPASALLPPGGQATFTASVAGANVAVTWSIQEGAAGGAITGGGAYTAPGSSGVFHVVATSVASPDVSGSATVTVSPAPPAGLPAQLAVLAGKAIYFGHASVGMDVMTGVRRLVADNPGADPAVVSTHAAGSMGPGVWAEDYNGTNFEPVTKIDAFDATIRGGVGAKVDVAFFKFCWVDFNADSTWFLGGGTAASLFARYQSAMAALKTAYPGVTFVHVTAPLYAAGYDAAQYQRNAQREQYNALVRSTYGGVEPVFDLALLESTDPSGNRVIGTAGPALYAGYTNDGGHLTAAAQDRFAAELIALLAGLP